ncbi:MAG: hypothetical protein J0I09_14390 [Sphingobacteriia bacterium]|nr:hypothetical protein [Sphingobacteriia bacterium]
MAIEYCKFCDHEATEEEWMSLVGCYDHFKTKGNDPNQFVECPSCKRILHIDYDLIDEDVKKRMQQEKEERIRMEEEKKARRERMDCPLCKSEIEQSDFLETVFLNDKPTLYFANLITHYRHNHISSWNKCSGRNGYNYRGTWFGDYDEEKAKVNERAKRQLIRKGHKELLNKGVTTETLKKLKGTTPETLKVAEKFLSNPINKN